MKSVHHFWLTLSAVKFCFRLFSNTLCGFPCMHPGFSGEQQSTTLSLDSYIYELLRDCNGTPYVPDKPSCSRIRPPIVRMLGLHDLYLYFGSLGIVICLSVFPVVIVRIWADLHSSEKPT